MKDKNDNPCEGGQLPSHILQKTMEEDMIRAGDVCYVKFSNGTRWLGKFIEVSSSEDGVYLIFDAFTLHDGLRCVRHINEGNTLLESIEPADPKMWDKAMKVRDIYLKALGSIGSACEEEQPNNREDNN